MVMLRRLVQVGSEYQMSTNSAIEAASRAAIASVMGFRRRALMPAKAAAGLAARSPAMARARSSSR